MSDPLDDLSNALELTGTLVSGIHGAEWNAPTPCAEWSVRDLVDHLVSGNFIFVDAITSEPPAAPRGTAVSDSDLLSKYRDSGAALVHAFHQPGILEKVVTVPFGSVPGAVAVHLRITEVLVHGWDLAMATGQPISFPEDLAERELVFSRPLLERIPPGRIPFAPSQPVSEHAPAVDRLAALLGRRITN